MNKHTWILPISILALLWFVIIVVSYFIMHKPFSPVLALEISRIVGQLTVAGSIAAIAGGIGMRILPVLDIGTLTNLSLQSAFGFGFLGILVLIFSASIGIKPPYFWLVFILLGIIFRREIIKWARSWGELFDIWQYNGRFGKLLGYGTLVILFSTLLTALSPPIKFDSLVYHLTLPELYINNGKFIYVPENMFWGMPQLGEMLYTFSITLGGLQTATILGWMFGILALVGLFGYINHQFELHTSWIAIATLLTGYTLTASLSWGYVDWMAAFFGLAVFVYLDVWRRREGLKELLLAGVFTGLSLGVKYTSGLLLLAGLVVIIYQVITVEKKRKRLVSHLLLYFIPVFIVSLPWWIKNVFSTGNSFYPFFIPSGAMDDFRIQFYQIPSWGNWLDILFLPIRATIVGVEGAPGYNASIGPLLLALSPLAFLGWSRFVDDQRASISTAGLIASVGVIVWVIAGRFSAYLIQSRLYTSIFPAIAFLAGAGYFSISKVSLFGIRFRRVVEALVLFVFGLSVIEVSVATLNQGALTASLNLLDKEDYLNHNLGWYGPAMKQIRELPEGSKVLMLWEPRSLYCLPKCTPDEILDRWMHDRHLYDSQSTIITSWLDEGNTHLLYYKAGADFIRGDDARYSTSDWEILEQVLDDLPLINDFGGVYYLYKL